MLQVKSLVKSFGGLMATDHLSFEVPEGELHAVIGPNGAGKTTLISQLTGELHHDSGSIHFNGADISRQPTYRRSALGLARSFQITNIFQNMTAQENVALAVQAHTGHSFRFWKDVRREASVQEPALEILKLIDLHERADVPAKKLSHGEQRQLEIAMALATRPKMLLLDEPTAGMGAEESASMVGFLQGLKEKLTILLIEHDMDVVFTLADRITVLVYGRKIACDTPENIRSNQEVRAAYLGEEV